MKVIRVKRVSGRPVLRVVPRAEEVQKAPVIETGVPQHELLKEVSALCSKSNSVCDQMGRIRNMGEGFDRDKAVGLYQRIAVLRASGISLSAKLAEKGFDKLAAFAAVEHVTQQAATMMRDLEHRIVTG